MMRIVEGTEPERDSRQRAVRRWTAALILLCAASLWLQFKHIDSTLPYPWETDERPIAAAASRILQAGTLNPTTFYYPSLPTYLTALGMAGGFLRSAARLEISDIQRVGNIAYPYYESPGVMRGARQLFAVLAVIALAATGAAAWQAFRAPATIFLAPLALLTTELFFHHSWAYLNVDIVATCFAMLTLAACLQGSHLPSIRQSAVIPGLFAGFATGSKYTVSVLILSVLMAAGIYFKGTRTFWAALAAIGAMIAAFLLAVPFSLIAVRAFLDGVAYEAAHYAQGHIGADADPGWPQVIFYGRHFLSEFGRVGVAAAGIGLWAGVKADWRRSAVLVVFPVALLWLLTSQRVHFPRNVLSVHPIVAMFVANGVLTVRGWALAVGARSGWNAPRVNRVALVAGVVIAVTAIPVWHLRDHVRDRTDSRNLAKAYIEERVPLDWTIVVPRELSFDARPLTARGSRVMEIDLQSAQDTVALERLLGSVQLPAVVLVPHWGADSRFPGQETADMLNKASSQVAAVKTFGNNPVLVNYTPPTAWGDPAFAIAVLGQQPLVSR